VIRVESGRMRVAGEIKLADVAQMAAQGSEALRRGVRVVDFAETTAVDSSAIALVLEWTREARRLGTALQLEHVPEAMKNLAALYGITDFLAIER